MEPTSGWYISEEPAGCGHPGTETALPQTYIETFTSDIIDKLEMFLVIANSLLRVHQSPHRLFSNAIFKIIQAIPGISLFVNQSDALIKLILHCSCKFGEMRGIILRIVYGVEPRGPDSCVESSEGSMSFSVGPLQPSPVCL